MTSELTSGPHRIISLIGNSPTSVNLTRPAFQTVFLNGPVTIWTLRAEGGRLYLGIGGYSYTGAQNNNVTASIYAEDNRQWVAIYQEHQRAFNIVLIDDVTSGWTVNGDSNNAPIVLSPVMAQPSNPPMYSTSQLFRIVPAPDE